MKKYSFGFDWTGIVLFFLIMIPNVIWGFIPAPVDVLRKESVTGAVDVIGTVFQILMIGSLTFIINNRRPKISLSLFVIFCLASTLIYFLCWI